MWRTHKGLLDHIKLTLPKGMCFLPSNSAVPCSSGHPREKGNIYDSMFIVNQLNLKVVNPFEQLLWSGIVDYVDFRYPMVIKKILFSDCINPHLPQFSAYILFFSTCAWSALSQIHMFNSNNEYLKMQSYLEVAFTENALHFYLNIKDFHRKEDFNIYGIKLKI